MKNITKIDTAHAAKFGIADVSGSGYPIHICNNEENTLCGVDLKTKGISWVKDSQLHVINHGGLCLKCSKIHYR